MPKRRKAKAQNTFFSLIRGVFFGEVALMRKPRVVLARNGAEGPPVAAPEAMPQKKFPEKTWQEIQEELEDAHQESKPTQPPGMWEETLHQFAKSDKEIFEGNREDPEDAVQNKWLKKLEAARSGKKDVEIVEEKPQEPEAAIMEEVRHKESHKQPEAAGKRGRKPWGVFTEEEKWQAIKDRAEKLNYSREAYLKDLQQKYPKFKEKGLPRNEVEKFARFEDLLKIRGERENEKARAAENKQEIEIIKPAAKSLPDLRPDPLLPNLDAFKKPDLPVEVPPEPLSVENWVNERYPQEIIDAEIVQPEEKVADFAKPEDVRPLWETEERFEQQIGKMGAMPEAPEAEKAERPSESPEMKEKIDELLGGEMLGNERVRIAAQNVIEARGILITTWPATFEKRRIISQEGEKTPEEDAYEKTRNALIAAMMEVKEEELRGKVDTDTGKRKNAANLWSKIEVGEELRLLNMKQEALPAKWAGRMNKLGQYYNGMFEKVLGKDLAKSRHARIAVGAVVATGIGFAGGMSAGALAAYGGYRLTMPYVMHAANMIGQVGIRWRFESVFGRKASALEKEGAKKIAEAMQLNEEFMNEQREMLRHKAEKLSKKAYHNKRRAQGLLVAGNIAFIGYRSLASLGEIAGATQGDGNLGDHLASQRLAVHPPVEARNPSGAPAEASKAAIVMEKPAKTVTEKPVAVKESVAKAAIETASNEKIATVGKHGFWGAAQDLRRQGAFGSVEKFNDAWEHSTVVIGGKEVPIHQAGYVQRAQLMVDKSTNRLVIIEADKHFKVGTNQDLHEVLEKAGKRDPRWLREELAAEHHKPSDAEIAETAAARAGARPAAPPPKDFVDPFKDLDKYQIWIDQQYAELPLADQEEYIEALRESTAKLRHSLTEADPLVRPDFEELANIADKKVLDMETHPSYLEQKAHWADTERGLREQLGLSRQQFSDLTHKWTVGRLLDVVQHEELGTKGKVTELERMLAHNQGAMKLVQNIKHNGGGGPHTNHLRVGEFLKIIT